MTKLELQTKELLESIGKSKIISIKEKYNIVRYYESGRKKIIYKSVSLEIAKLHCSSPYSKAIGYFDGFTPI